MKNHLLRKSDFFPTFLLNKKPVIELSNYDSVWLLLIKKTSNKCRHGASLGNHSCRRRRTTTALQEFYPQTVMYGTERPTALFRSLSASGRCCAIRLDRVENLFHPNNFKLSFARKHRKVICPKSLKRTREESLLFTPEIENQQLVIIPSLCLILSVAIRGPCDCIYIAS